MFPPSLLKLDTELIPFQPFLQFWYPVRCMSLSSIPFFFHELITPWQEREEKQRQARGWLPCLFLEEATQGDTIWGELRAPGGGARVYARAKPSHWGQSSLWEVAPHVSEFLWAHHLVLADRLCFSEPLLPGWKAMRQSLMYEQQRAKAINSAQLSAPTAPVPTRSHPGLSPLLCILTPSSFPPWHHFVGNPKTIILEWEHWKRLRTPLPTPSLH